VSADLEAVALEYAQRVHDGETWIDAGPLDISTRNTALRVAQQRGWIEFEDGPGGAPLRDGLRPSGERPGV